MRHWFGQTLTDWSMTLGTPAESNGVRYADVAAVGPKTVTMWNADTGGSQYTDLLDVSGAAVSEITTADGTGTLALGTIPRFQGPDGVALLWADAGGGARYLMIATDLADTLGDLTAVQSDVDGLQATVGALAPISMTGAWGDLTGVPDFADVAFSGEYDDVQGAPAPGLQIVVKAGDTWPLRATSAPDTSRPCQWRGPAPGPPAGSGYALPGDDWQAWPS